MIWQRAQSHAASCHRDAPFQESYRVDTRDPAGVPWTVGVWLVFCSETYRLLMVQLCLLLLFTPSSPPFLTVFPVCACVRVCVWGGGVVYVLQDRRYVAAQWCKLDRFFVPSTIISEIL